MSGFRSQQDDGERRGHRAKVVDQTLGPEISDGISECRWLDANLASLSTPCWQFASSGAHAGGKGA